MRRIMMFLTLAAVILLVIAGCSRTSSFGGTEADRNKFTSGGNEVFEEAYSDKVNTPLDSKGERDEVLPSSLNEGTTEQKADLIIKSENQVLAGSNQSMVNELDKELDNLVDALNKLDTISENDLDIE